MPIEMPKGLPFSVDTFSASSSLKRHHFLTHAHKDHSQGIISHSCFPIYATSLTKSITLNYYPDLSEALFVDIEIGQSIIIDDDDEFVDSFTVTAFDANHCPGAVMFLFEGTFGNILHTGDCRLTPECLQKLPDKYIGTASRKPKCRLDYVFLDCTFGAFSSKLPSKHVAVQQVINCIWKHPDARVVYLTCDLLGQEEILASVSQTFGRKIFIDKENKHEYSESLSLTIPEVISHDTSSRFHIFDGFPRLTERAEAKLAEARANCQPEPLIIRPSTQWYVYEDVSSDAEKRKSSQFNEAIRDKFGIWHVCYSMHSSRDELEWALQLLAPRWVVSTTPECRAMELSYVKKHCSYGNLAPDDPLWKLLDIDLMAPFANEDIQKEVCISSPPFLGSEMESSQTFVTKKEILTMSSQVNESTVTLFGRARLGLDNSTLIYKDLIKPVISYHKEEVKAVWYNEVSTHKDVSYHKEEVKAGWYNEVSTHKDVSYHKEVKAGWYNEVSTHKDVSESEHGESKSQELTGVIVKHTSAYSPTKGVGENMRKLYRSMHVPVPKPLPSLVDLLNNRKRAKRCFS